MDAKGVPSLCSRLADGGKFDHACACVACHLAQARLGMLCQHLCHLAAELHMRLVDGEAKPGQASSSLLCSIRTCA